ncbi:hypothetical protein [Chamaesiphon sp.]|uniref:hypothetical protein n=1 Tax=Chamaesiphon sp. TaxID=2814140 RepID=UPI003593C2A1
MFNRQFGIIAIVALLLSSSLVQAREIDDDPSDFGGNVRIETTQNETIIQTPKILIVAPKVPVNKVVGSRARRRKSIRTSTVINSRKPLNSNRQIIGIPNIAPIRSSTIRRSNNNADSQSSIEQYQSVQCGGSGSSVSQSSTSTVNGRTVRSEVHRNCW